ncbi:aminotransferase class IV [Capnocytophaga canis]|uniref:branched-chain-amino-acid transaminase n=1 Tax=Capnocytophaga canis TaxID=1848903 RepID=A0A3A1YK71_9FLAO|nr:aminotransferase class IV [Capnocytophaga canis]RIY36624.1 aminotransferase class IV [Capnocytophaga canis]
MKINYNGTFLSSEELILSCENRGFKYGDAVFDTIKYTNQKLVFWEEHYLRLMAGMRILRMEIPMNFTLEFLENEILKTLNINKLNNTPTRVRMTVSRKNGGLYTPHTNDVDYLIEVHPISSIFYELHETPYEVELFKDFYLQPDLLANVKHTNRIINIIGSVFAKENDYQNCILLNSNKNVAGALNGNLFMVEGNKLKTPPLTDGCINGITRKVLINLLKKIPEFEVIETSISPFELQKADELFITNSIIGIQPITKYRKKTYTNLVAKSLIGKLNTAARFGVS